MFILFSVLEDVAENEINLGFKNVMLTVEETDHVTLRAQRSPVVSKCQPSGSSHDSPAHC